MKRRYIPALFVAAMVLALPVLAFADVSATADVTPTILANAIANPGQISAATYTLLMAIVGFILALVPTSHDEGTMPGRAVNLIKMAATGLMYVTQVVTGLIKVKDAPAPEAAAPAAPAGTPATPAQQ